MEGLKIKYIGCKLKYLEGERKVYFINFICNY